MSFKRRFQRKKGQDNYLAPLLQHAGGIYGPGSVVHVEVRHDDWCAFFEGGGCDCEPEIESSPRIQRKYE